MTSTKLSKRIFSFFTVLLILFSQSPLGTILGTVGTASAATDFTVTSPNGGETLNGTKTITWASVVSGSVDIWYCAGVDCTNASYTLIAGGEENDGSYDWNTTTAGGDSSQYKVRISLPGGANGDISDAYFTIDNTAPASGSFTINNGATYTSSTSVTLNTTCAVDGLVGGVEVAFGNTASPTNRQSCTSSMAWTLTAGDASKTVYMRFKDSLGNTTSDTTDSILFDGTSPTVSVGSDIVTNHGLTINGLVNGDIAGVASYLRTNNDSLIGNFTIPGAVVNAQNLTITNASANGVYTVQLTVTDNAGNTNNNTMELTWDTIAPTVSSIVTTPTQASGMVAVVVTFTEALAGIDSTVAPTVLFNNGSDHAVTANATAGHTNGYVNATPTIWEGIIDVSALGDTNTGYFKVSGSVDLAGNTMTANNNVGSLSVDKVGPTYTDTDDVIAGPVKSDTIRVTIADATTSVNGSTVMYGFSLDDTCNESDTYGNSFSSAVDFVIAGNHTDYLCVTATDVVGNKTFHLVGQLNTDNTAPSTPTISTPIATPSSDTTPNIGISVSESNGQSIKIYQGGTLFQTIATPTNGANTITLTDVGQGVHNNFSATFTDQAGNESVAASIPSFTTDITAPVVVLTPLSSDYTNDNTPTFTGTVTDNLTNIVSVEYRINGGGEWIPAQGTFDSNSESYTFTPDTLVDGTYTVYVRATDAVGNVTISYATDAFVVDTTHPTVTFNIPTDASKTMSIAGQSINTGLSSIYQVEYFLDTVGSNDAGTDLTLAAGTTTRNFNGSIDVSGLSNGTHTLYVHTKNIAGTRGPITYDSFNVNSEAPDITSLYVSNVDNDSATIHRTSDTAPDTAEFRIKENNGTFGAWSTLASTQNLSTLNVNTTYIVEIRLSIGKNLSTDTISFTTSSASEGIIVTSINRILDNSTPTAGGGYASGYHFRFGLTINNIRRDVLNFKLSNRSNSLNTMAVANNTKIFVSEGGISSADVEGESTTLTVADTYSSDLDIDGIDSNASVGGNQIILDMFYKIPTGSQGIFSTSYGIQVSSNIK